jgi:tetratricopeptide (TPR) repeat protein
VAVEPSFWPSVNNIGLVLYEQGSVDAAIEQWRSALEISPEEPEPKLAIAVATYSQQNCTPTVSLLSSAACREALEMGTEALEQDSRYADLDYLEENLWGASLLRSTGTFFNAPDIQRLLAEL